MLLLATVSASLCAQQIQVVGPALPQQLPDAPSSTLAQQQSAQPSGNTQTGEREPNPKLGKSSIPQQNSARTPVIKEQPKRILYVIPNYRAVSSDSNLPPLDFNGKFRLFFDDSFDYSTFLYVGFLAGIGLAQDSVPEFHQGGAGYGRYYWHIFADQALGNTFTEWLLPVALKQDPRYFTLGHGSFVKRSGYALSRLVVTRTDSGGSAPNYSEVIGNGAAAGISGLYYPQGYRTWTKTGQRWAQQLALDATFNVLKEFWPDIAHAVFRQQYVIEGDTRSTEHR